MDKEEEVEYLLIQEVSCPLQLREYEAPCLCEIKEEKEEEGGGGGGRRRRRRRNKSFTKVIEPDKMILGIITSFNDVLLLRAFLFFSSSFFVFLYSALFLRYWVS